MRVCLLRAGLSRASGGSKFVLGNPKAWLGTAYHEVLEKIVHVDLGQEPLLDAVARLWNEAVAAQERRAKAHALDRRFGPPVGWPGYHVARASVLLRAEELAGKPTPPELPIEKQTRSIEAAAATLREHEFTAFGGKLLGRPDVVRADEVVDYKSGAIFEHDAATQTDVVKATYVRQLHIYAYLVKQQLGWWPQRGILLPLGGAGIEIAFEPSACEREAKEALALLDEYNDRLRAGAGPEDFASPSPENCRWCQYKLVCSSFWKTSSPAWSGHLDGAAVEGVLADGPAMIHAGAARAVSLDIQGGSEVRRRAQIAPLNISTHPAVTTLAPGDSVRFIGLRARPDGVLAPSDRTVLFRLKDLPFVNNERGPIARGP